MSKKEGPERKQHHCQPLVFSVLMNVHVEKGITLIPFSAIW